MCTAGLDTLEGLLWMGHAVNNRTLGTGGALAEHLELEHKKEEEEAFSYLDPFCPVPVASHHLSFLLAFLLDFVNAATSND